MLSSVFSVILAMSLTATVVIVAVLLIRLLLRKAPKKYSYMLWLIVAFRLLCPVALPSSLSLFNVSALQPPEAPAIVETVDRLPETAATIRFERTHGISEDVTPVTPSEPTTPSDPVTPTRPVIPVTPRDPVSPSEENQPKTEPEAAEPDLMTAFGAVWLVGAFCMLAYGVFSYVRVRLRVRTSVRLNGNVYECETIGSPFILGILKPVIYIPYGLTEAEKSYVIAHERYHIKRFDPQVKPLAFLLLCVHWFNPLCWVAFFMMGRDMEMSCDEKVIGSGEDIRRAYSTSLLSFATGKRKFPSPCPLAFGESSVKSRIRNVLKWKKPKLWLSVSAVVICLVVLVACVTDPVKKPDDDLPLKERLVNAAADAYAADRTAKDSYRDWFDLFYRLETGKTVAEGYKKDGKVIVPLSDMFDCLERHADPNAPFIDELAEDDPKTVDYTDYTPSTPAFYTADLFRETEDGVIVRLAVFEDEAKTVQKALAYVTYTLDPDDETAFRYERTDAFDYTAHEPDEYQWLSDAEDHVKNFMAYGLPALYGTNLITSLKTTDVAHRALTFLFGEIVGGAVKAPFYDPELRLYTVPASDAATLLHTYLSVPKDAASLSVSPAFDTEKNGFAVDPSSGVPSLEEAYDFQVYKGDGRVSVAIQTFDDKHELLDLYWCRLGEPSADQTFKVISFAKSGSDDMKRFSEQTVVVRTVATGEGTYSRIEEDKTGRTVAESLYDRNNVRMITYLYVYSPDGTLLSKDQYVEPKEPSRPQYQPPVDKTVYYYETGEPAEDGSYTVTKWYNSNGNKITDSISYYTADKVKYKTVRSSSYSHSVEWFDKNGNSLYTDHYQDNAEWYHSRVYWDSGKRISEYSHIDGTMTRNIEILQEDHKRVIIKEWVDRDGNVFLRDDPTAEDTSRIVWLDGKKHVPLNTAAAIMLRSISTSDLFGILPDIKKNPDNFSYYYHLFYLFHEMDPSVWEVTPEDPDFEKYNIEEFDDPYYLVPLSDITAFLAPYSDRDDLYSFLKERAMNDKNYIPEIDCVYEMMDFKTKGGGERFEDLTWTPDGDILTAFVTVFSDLDHNKVSKVTEYRFRVSGEKCVYLSCEIKPDPEMDLVEGFCRFGIADLANCGAMGPLYDVPRYDAAIWLLGERDGYDLTEWWNEERRGCVVPVSVAAAILNEHFALEDIEGKLRANDRYVPETDGFDIGEGGYGGELGLMNVDAFYEDNILKLDHFAYDENWHRYAVSSAVLEIYQVDGRWTFRVRSFEWK